MKQLISLKRITTLIAAVCLFSLPSLAQEHSHGSRERGEHNSERKGEGKREGEEDGTQYSLSQTYNKTKHGAKLVLKYNKAKNAFVGTVTNVSNKTLKRVRVEVHTNNGKEIGPTKPVTLKPRQSKEVILKAESKNFTAWSTHAEVGNNEHGGKGERKEGHRSREKGEHGHGK